MCSSCDYFWFGSVFTYKNNQTEILCNTKNKIKTESKLVQTEQFRFGYLKWKTKTKPTDFGSVQFGFGVVRFGLVILYFKKKLYCFFGFFLDFLICLVSVCSVWFFSVQFGFSIFRLIKPKLNRIKYFFNIIIGLISFFSWFNFLGYFFI